MQTKKQSINAQLFVVTVLSAWLGLMIVSVPTQVYSQQIAQRLTETNKVSNNPCDLDILENEARKAFSSIGLDLYFIADLVQGLDYEFFDDEDNLQAASFDIEVIIDYPAKGKSKITSSITTTQKSDGKGNITDPRNPDIATSVTRVAEQLSRGISQNKKPQSVHLKLKLDETEFFASLKFAQKNADLANRFADAYNKHIAYENCSNEGTPDLNYFLYQNNRVFVEGNQVLIVTRLPRGSLDALLAAK